MPRRASSINHNISVTRAIGLIFVPRIQEERLTANHAQSFTVRAMYFTAPYASRAIMCTYIQPE